MGDGGRLACDRACGVVVLAGRGRACCLVVRLWLLGRFLVMAGIFCLVCGFGARPHACQPNPIDAAIFGHDLAVPLLGETLEGGTVLVALSVLAVVVITQRKR